MNRADAAYLKTYNFFKIIKEIRFKIIKGFKMKTILNRAKNSTIVLKMQKNA